jgi:hypothetical protein
MSALPSNVRAAASNFRLPMPHHGHTMSDQIST